MKAWASFFVLFPLLSFALGQSRPIPPGIRQASFPGIWIQAQKNREARQTIADPAHPLGARRKPSAQGLMAQNSRNFRK